MNGSIIRSNNISRDFYRFTYMGMGLQGSLYINFIFLSFIKLDNSLILNSLPLSVPIDLGGSYYSIKFSIRIIILNALLFFLTSSFWITLKNDQ